MELEKSIPEAANIELGNAPKTRRKRLLLPPKYRSRLSTAMLLPFRPRAIMPR
jgi:hypothetical protein